MLRIGWRRAKERFITSQIILISKVRVGLALNVKTRSDNTVLHRVLTDLDIAVYTLVVPASRTIRAQEGVAVPQMLRSYVTDLVYVC